MIRPEQPYDMWKGEDAATGEQYLVRKWYEPSGGHTWTVSRRDHEGATWGPEAYLEPLERAHVGGAL